MADDSPEASSPGEVLEAPNILEYPYTRTTGPILGRFFTSLREGRIEGIRTPSGQVVVPPTEFDPATGDGLTADDMVEVGPSGIVETWAWVTRPRGHHPFDRPFGWALIRLDGADTAMLHAIDVAPPSALATGVRVTARWRSAREGHIRDIECFVLAGEG